MSEEKKTTQFRLQISREKKSDKFERLQINAFCFFSFLFILFCKQIIGKNHSKIIPLGITVRKTLSFSGINLEKPENFSKIKK